MMKNSGRRLRLGKKVGIYFDKVALFICSCDCLCSSSIWLEIFMNGLRSFDVYFVLYLSRFDRFFTFTPPTD